LFLLDINTSVYLSSVTGIANTFAWYAPTFGNAYHTPGFIKRCTSIDI
jgi:hypothetical protein